MIEAKQQVERNGVRIWVSGRGKNHVAAVHEMHKAAKKIGGQLVGKITFKEV